MLVAALPSDPHYSPLWFVNVYDNADFDTVRDLGTMQAADLVPTEDALVNCPVVSITDAAGAPQPPS